MSSSQDITLNDNKVSWMIAAEAMHDPTFKQQLLDFVSSLGRIGSKVPRTIEAQTVLEAIDNFRQQLLNEAGLKPPPHDYSERTIDMYLKQNITSRPLVAKGNPEQEGGLETTSKEVLHEWGWVGSPTCIAGLALDFMLTMLRFEADPTPFPFERLPPEIRLQVYREAFNGVLRCNGRSRRGRNGFGKSMVVTYHKTNKFQYRFLGQARGESKEINASLLVVNKLVNKEAIPVLYQSRTFEFMNTVTTVARFLSSLPQDAQQNLHGISMELRDIKEPDRCCGGVNKTYGKGQDNQVAWGRACTYISENTRVEQLEITINVKVAAGFKSLKWVKALVKIKGLKHLTLVADQHWSTHPLLTLASYEDGKLLAEKHCRSEHLFTLFEYLRKKMLV